MIHEFSLKVPDIEYTRHLELINKNHLTQTDWCLEPL